MRGWAPVMSIAETPVGHPNRWTGPTGFSPLVVSVMLAIGLAALAGLISERLARQYWGVMAYYPDSSAYRYYAIQAFEVLRRDGWGAALMYSLALKDGLDVTLRVVLWPSMLTRLFGHLAVLVPLMSSFMFLTIWYVYRKTQSFFAGVLTVGSLFSAGLIYGPFAGISDYLKDVVGCWLVGIACMTWLLADQMAHRRWTFLCGLSLGMLVMQRTGAAIYLAPLFMVLFLVAVRTRVHADGWARALRQMALFAVPAVLLTLLVLAVQLATLRTYYFGYGFNYGSFGFIARSLAEFITAQGGRILWVVPVLWLLSALGMTRWPDRIWDVAIALWFVVGFPVAIVLSGSGFVAGFYTCWTVLLVVLLATLIPRASPQANRRALRGLALVVIAVGSVSQYNSASDLVTHPNPHYVAMRETFVKIANILVSQPEEPRRYSMIFTEASVDFWNIVYFDVDKAKGLSLLNVGVFSVHDTYYTAQFGDMSAERIVQEDVARFEKSPGTIVVANCKPEDVLKQSWFIPNPAVPYLATGNSLAATIAVQLADYVRRSPRWKAIGKLDSPFGCLYAYRYEPEGMSEAAKWQDVAMR
jgi:hypothetical protein